MTLEEVLEAVYGTTVLSAPPEAIIWAADRVAREQTASEAAAQLKAVN